MNGWSEPSYRSRLHPSAAEYKLSSSACLWAVLGTKRIPGPRVHRCAKALQDQDRDLAAQVGKLAQDRLSTHEAGQVPVLVG
jgi:hypothetical protein